MDRPRTKQVCTIGPASADKIPDLVAAGMDVARINFAHGTPEDHKAYVHAVRAAAHSARRSVAVMADLPGPKLRLGELEGGELRLETGAKFALRSEAPAEPIAEIPAPALEAEHIAEPTEEAPPPAESTVASEAPNPPQPDPEPDTSAHVATMVLPMRAAGAVVRGAHLARMLQVGDRVLLADGAVELRVSSVSADDVVTEVVSGGLIRTRSGVNVPSERFGNGGLTDDDRAAIPRALELRVDLIAQSFVRSAADVVELKRLLPADGPRVVAKIETQAAVDDFPAICAAADGIMVARGDLGVDVPFEQVPLIQKTLVKGALAMDRFSIVATQMMESMTGSPRPTRAEASDVANAVLDGADAVMLSAETAIGSYPVESLTAMSRICHAAEATIEGTAAFRPGRPDRTPAEMITGAATMSATLGQLEDGHGPGAIWCFTRSGRTAELLSLQRPGVPVVAFTLSPVVARRLAVRRGVVPLVLPAGAKSSPLIDQMETAWRAQRASNGDVDSVMVVTTSSNPGGINRLEIHRLSGAGTARRP